MMSSDPPAMSVAEALAEKIAAVKPGGVIMHIGLQDWTSEIDMRKLTLAEITLIGTYTYTTAALRATVRALAQGVFGDLAVDYRERAADDGRPKQWTVFSLPGREPIVRLNVEVDHGTWNQPIDPTAFVLDVTGRAPMTIDELRQSGPLRKRSER